MSEAINELIRAGLRQETCGRDAFRQVTHDLGHGIDVTNIGEVMETLDGAAAP